MAMKVRSALLGVVCASIVVFSCASAAAQRLGGQRFTPAASEDGVLSTEGADPRREHWPYVALWGHYSLDPVVLRQGGEDASAVAEHVLGMDLVGSIQVVHGLELGFGLPVTLFSNGDEGGANLAGLEAADGAAVGDLILRAAYRFRLGYADSLAIHVPVRLPTSEADDVLSFGTSVRPTLAYVHGFERADLIVNLSYRWRERVNVLDHQGGQELGARVATRVGLDDRWTTTFLGELGVSSSVHDFFGASETPVDAQVGLEHWFGEHFRLSAFVGTALSTGVGAPDLRTGVGVAFGQKPYRPRIEPRPGDRDADGIPDEEDECPDAPEDEDGFEDEDGCPDDDNDSDGVLDVEDRCPLDPEIEDGFEDEDGCPDRIRVEGSLITTFEPVRFRTGSTEILPESHAMLREVAVVMDAHPTMELRIEGHTDSEGDDELNLRLSQQRAESVRRFLIRRGVARDRIEAVGHGEERSVATNETAEGRRLNRRVEFHIAEE